LGHARQHLFVRPIKASNDFTINVNDRDRLLHPRTSALKANIFHRTFLGELQALRGEHTHLSVHKNRYDNLTPAISVARDVPWKIPHILHPDDSPFGGCNATYTPAKCDGLTGRFAVKRSQDKLSRVAWVKGVKT
jgi:hypothetical protein